MSIIDVNEWREYFLPNIAEILARFDGRSSLFADLSAMFAKSSAEFAGFSAEFAESSANSAKP